MKRRISAFAIGCLTVSIAFLQTACNKDNSAGSIGSGTTSSSETIAVASNASVANSDSVYIIQQCGPGGKRDSIAQSSLPSAVGNYLDSNYSGSIFYRAYSINDSAGTITGYVVVIYYNDKPVGLEFNAAGEFVKVLEQREGDDQGGNDHRHGRHFPFRDNGLDTVAISNLSSAITGYINTNYATDTIVKAYINTDSSYIVLSKNNGLFATIFTYTGTFVNRISLSGTHEADLNIDQSALPATVLTYLDTTYPGYTFKKAFSLSAGATVNGYVVFIDANNTKYAVVFDGSGDFVGVRTVR